MLFFKLNVIGDPLYLPVWITGSFWSFFCVRWRGAVRINMSSRADIDALLTRGRDKTLTYTCTCRSHQSENSSLLDINLSD